LGTAGIVGGVLALLDRYGYLAILGVVGVESFGVPAPGQTILIAAAVYAGTGHLNLTGVAVAAFFAATVGDNLGYLIGRFGGRRLVQRFGRYVFLTERRLERIAAVMDRHGSKVVTVARFVDGLRQLNGIVSGMTGMPWQRFLGYNALGAALWVAIWVSVGRFAGHHLGWLAALVHRFGPLVVLAVLAGAGWVVWQVLRRRRAPARRIADADVPY
jgi:membrane protein DedA with SNARE-associated domain